jgi:hypothetical protein
MATVDASTSELFSGSVLRGLMDEKDLVPYAMGGQDTARALELCVLTDRLIVSGDYNEYGLG